MELNLIEVEAGDFDRAIRMLEMNYVKNMVGLIVINLQINGILKHII